MKSITMGKGLEEDYILIRSYNSSDYPATLELLKELYDSYDIGLKEGQWIASSGLRQFKPNFKRETLIAELKSTKEVVGMGVIEALRNHLGNYTGYLNNWAIKKELIGKSMGKHLADKAIQILKSWGCDSIRINLDYNVPEKLIKVFGIAGFQPILVVLEKRFED